MTSRSDLVFLDDFRSVGFDPEQIAAFLRGHGVEIGEATDSKPVKEATQHWPDWKLALAAHEKLSTWQAACALADIDPHQSGYLGDDERAEISRWESALDDSAALTFEMDSGKRFPLAAFSDWCNEKGIPYPLPRSAPLPATDPELRAALEAERKAASEWEAKARKHETEAALRRAAEEAKANHGELKGKDRTSLLKIIAGLAHRARMWEPGSDRNKGHGALSEYMRKIGVGVDEKTLTKWLGEAKKEIPAKPPSAG